MAGEEIFTANAILTFCGILVFLVFYIFAELQKKTIWKLFSLNMILLVLLYGVTIQEWGFNVTGAYAPRDVAQTIQIVLVYGLETFFAVTLALMGLELGQNILDAFTGKNNERRIRNGGSH
jgi:hypothetical protein